MPKIRNLTSFAILAARLFFSRFLPKKPDNSLFLDILKKFEINQKYSLIKIPLRVINTHGKREKNISKKHSRRGDKRMQNEYVATLLHDFLTFSSNCLKALGNVPFIQMSVPDKEIVFAAAESGIKFFYETKDNYQLLFRAIIDAVKAFSN